MGEVLEKKRLKAFVEHDGSRVNIAGRARSAPPKG
jgi:hypothetical protein